jgi:hypothetical protein
MGARHPSVPGVYPNSIGQSQTDVERETGFEPATPSLEGWRSTPELFPLACFIPHPCGRRVVARGGFEPPKAFASRFTVCPLWPLGYLAIGPSARRIGILRIEPGLRLRPGPPVTQPVELAKGFEPPACCLQGSRSTPELRQQATKLHSMCQDVHCQQLLPPIRPRKAPRRLSRSRWPARPAAGRPRRGARPPPPRR